ncbi:ABC transporter permease [Candidatus Aerophobetes bacterium]|nr:ABC transporter permease [Candidatus Aerophobetes bacterium]
MAESTITTEKHRVNPIKFVVAIWRRLGGDTDEARTVGVTFLILLGLFILMAFSSRMFLSPRNLRNILTQTAMYVILATGMTFVMALGQIDISIGSMAGIITAVIGDVIVNQGRPVWLGILAGLGVGLLCGMFNAFWITFVKVPAIIVTLGTWTMFRGLAYAYLGGTIYYGFPDSFVSIARGRFLDLPYPVWIAAVVLICGYLFLTRTRTGRYITAIGGNEDAARRAGINAKWIRFMVFSLMGLLAGLATVIITARLDSSAAGTGAGFELHTIAAVVIGGTSLFGGQGLMFGSLMGVLMLGIVENGLLLAGISFFWQRVFLGLIFVSVVGFRTLKAGER